MQEIKEGEKMAYEVFLQRFIGNHWINHVIQDGVLIQGGVAQLKISEVSKEKLLFFETSNGPQRMNITAIVSHEKATFSYDSENKRLVVNIKDAPADQLKELCFVFEREPGEV
jgi:hypothetical protein